MTGYDTKRAPALQSLPPAWADVTPEVWNDWRWQLSHRLNTVEDFTKFLSLTLSEKRALSTPGIFRIDITPYFASLIDPKDPLCPIRKQVLPTEQEFEIFEDAKSDPLDEVTQSPVPGLVHRYPDRVLMLLTTQCASYCRFCTRSRIVGNAHMNYSEKDFNQHLTYISAHSQIRDVLLSGGDALLLPVKFLHSILQRLRAIPHVEIIRFSTRVPVFLPQRINEELILVLRQFHPLWMNIHFNHPKEITPEVSKALALLADGGIPLGSQTVLMAGINDCPHIIMALMHELVKNRVRPYYLYQCDPVKGAGHFRTPIAKGIEIMEALRGHTSGYAIPTYVVDAPGGGGKIALSPNYLLSMSEKRVALRNFEGSITTYPQPDTYQSHHSDTCDYCRSYRQRGNSQQGGVAALLENGSSSTSR